MNDAPVTTPGALVKHGDKVRLKHTKRTARAHVSRAGGKLAFALEAFGLSDAPAEAICIDIGSSTGGFTQALLEAGAKRVYAVDVGYGELDWRLREDPRVAVRERLNAKHITREHIPEPADIIVADVSFISLKSALPAALALLKENGLLITLVKPQFEAPRGAVGEGGVITDTALHASVCNDISLWMRDTAGLFPFAAGRSPVKGSKGNTEFLLAARKIPQKSVTAIAAEKTAPGADTL